MALHKRPKCHLSTYCNFFNSKKLQRFIDGWWARPDLNRGPSDYESPALTAELRAQPVLNKLVTNGVQIKPEPSNFATCYRLAQSEDTCTNRDH